MVVCRTRLERVRGRGVFKARGRSFQFLDKVDLRGCVQLGCVFV